MHPTCTPVYPSLQPHAPQVEAVARNGGCELLRLLGRALPSQSSFFINFLLQAGARYLVTTLLSQSSFFINFLVQARYLVITGRVSWLSPLLLHQLPAALT